MSQSVDAYFWIGVKDVSCFSFLSFFSFQFVLNNMSVEAYWLRLSYAQFNIYLLYFFPF